MGEFLELSEFFKAIAALILFFATLAISYYNGYRDGREDAEKGK